MITEHFNNNFQTLCGSVTNVFRRLGKHSIQMFFPSYYSTFQKRCEKVMCMLKNIIREHL